MSFTTAQEAVFIGGTTELYEIDFGSHVEYYNTSPRIVSFDSGSGPNDYVPLPIGRGQISRGTDLSLDEVSMTIPLEESMVQYLADTMPGSVEVRIIRGFGDPEVTPENYKVFWFIGLLSTVKWTRTVLQATLVSKDMLALSSMFPRVRQSSGCNNQLGDSVCGINLANYAYEFNVEGVEKAGMRLRVRPTSADPPSTHYNEGDEPSSTFPGAVTPGWYTLGKVYLDGVTGSARHIISHQWYSLTFNVCFFELQAPLPGIVDNTSVNTKIMAVAGCDKNIKLTCGPKFDNFKNAVGCPNIPKRDPVRYAWNSPHMSSKG